MPLNYIREIQKHNYRVESSINMMKYEAPSCPYIHMAIKIRMDNCNGKSTLKVLSNGFLLFFPLRKGQNGQ